MSKISLTDFVAAAVAEKDPDDEKQSLWLVWLDGDVGRCCIYDCVGGNAFEAKEDAYRYYEQMHSNLAKEELL